MSDAAAYEQLAFKIGEGGKSCAASDQPRLAGLRYELRPIECVMVGLCESTRTRVTSLGLGFLLLFAGQGTVAAQDTASRLFPASANDGCAVQSLSNSFTQSFPLYGLLPPAAAEYESRTASWGRGPEARLWPGLGPERSTGTALAPFDALAFQDAAAIRPQPCPMHELLRADFSDSKQRMALSALTADDVPQLQDSKSELPRWEFLERNRLLFSTLVPITAVGGVMANSLVAYNTNHPFRISHEGWFGPDTTNGGADKASHLTDYFIVANLFNDVYRMLGYSENVAILWGFGLAVATGFANEMSDGFTRHGFSPEDLAMDAAGAATASVISVTHTQDLLGMRTSHLPSDTYTHDVYSADFRLSGLGQRLGLNLGPLRWLLFSVTYGAKGYRVQPPIEHERQVGFEIGLNLQQILNDVGVKRNTWWGYSLHLVGDNIRFPFTAVGIRYDLNHGKWHGPNSGNYD